MGEENPDKEAEKGFKVVDRRRFDSEGKDREESPEPQTATTKEAVLKESTSADDKSQEPITLSSFIMSLATQALIHLGEVKPPAGMNVAPDREAAKQTIDLLSMLETKTKGNRDKEEEYLITEILHDLRLRFVRKAS